MTYGDITWELDSVIDEYDDQREVWLNGRAECDEGSHLGHFEFKGTSHQIHPFVEGEFHDVKIVESEFIPHEPEAER